jgi:hypothetical protein
MRFRTHIDDGWAGLDRLRVCHLFGRHSRQAVQRALSWPVVSVEGRPREGQETFRVVVLGMLCWMVIRLRTRARRSVGECLLRGAGEIGGPAVDRQAGSRAGRRGGRHGSFPWPVNPGSKTRDRASPAVSRPLGSLDSLRVWSGALSFQASRGKQKEVQPRRLYQPGVYLSRTLLVRLSAIGQPRRRQIHRLYCHVDLVELN